SGGGIGLPYDLGGPKDAPKDAAFNKDGGCPPGLTTCGNVCTSTQSDAKNCGSCFNSCPTGYSCQNAQCVNGCAFSTCNGVCTNTNIDPNNCGFCGNFCSGGSCVNGTCGCPDVHTKCNGVCTNTYIDSS